MFFCVVVKMLKRKKNIKKNIKKLLKCANKKCKNLNIYDVIFLKIIKENTWRYHYFTLVYQKS